MVELGANEARHGSQDVHLGLARRLKLLALRLALLVLLWLLVYPQADREGVDEGDGPGINGWSASSAMSESIPLCNGIVIHNLGNGQAQLALIRQMASRGTRPRRGPGASTRRPWSPSRGGPSGGSPAGSPGPCSRARHRTSQAELSRHLWKRQI